MSSAVDHTFFGACSMKHCEFYLRSELGDRMNLLNDGSCNRYVAELTEEFEHKLGEDRQLRLQLHEEKTELDKEFTETKQQVEDDIDTEIDNLR